MATIGCQIKSGLTSAIFRKSLSLSASGRKDTSSGEVINLISIDLQRLTLAFNCKLLQIIEKNEMLSIRKQSIPLYPKGTNYKSNFNLGISPDKFNDYKP